MLDGQTVQEQQLDFTAYALKGTERVKLVIRRNNEKALKPTDGDTAYTETLSEGKNVFTLIAGTGTATVSESYTIYYDSQKQADDFTLTLEGEKNSSTITLQMSGGYQTFQSSALCNSDPGGCDIYSDLSVCQFKWLVYHFSVCKQGDTDCGWIY